MDHGNIKEMEVPFRNQECLLMSCNNKLQVSKTYIFFLYISQKIYYVAHLLFPAKDFQPQFIL